jgi:signal transduction histidine kinase
MRSPSSTQRTGGRAAPRRRRAPHVQVDASALGLSWSRAALGTSRCSVAVFVADRSGRLRSVSACGPAVKPTRRLSAARRRAFDTGRPHSVDRRTGRTRIACLPLRVDGQRVGVLQVSASISRIDADASLLLGVADAVSLVVAAEHRLRPVTDPSDLGLAWTAHELKGPLLGILALLDRSLDGHRDLEQLRRAERSLSDVVRQLDALLLPPGGSDALRKQDVDLVDLTREAIDRCEVEFGESRVVLHATEGLRVQADPMHLVSAISNVVRNALAYSDPDEKVEVTVEQDGEPSVVRVLDHGPGIPPEYLSSLFDPFVRGERGRARKHGTGLGLFIASRVIDLHGGSIDVESRPARTTVELRIPTGHPGGQR